MDPERIPDTAEAVAGYVDGNWPSYYGLTRDGSHRWIIGIATSSWHDAHVLDVEQGDATPADAATWIQRQHSRGFERPAVYCPLSAVAIVKRVCAARGVPRSSFRLWSAHWTGRPHLCGEACQRGFGTPAGATQYANLAARGVDVSRTTVGWLDHLVRDCPPFTRS